MPFDELLRARRDEIVGRFVKRSRVAVAGEARQPEASIVDHVPLLLDELADAVETGRTSLPPARVASRQHAQTRWQQGMDVRTLVREYGALRDTVLEVCGHPTAADLATVDRYFNASIANAVAEYVAMVETQGAALRAQLEQENGRLARVQQSLAVLSEAGAVLAAASDDHRRALQGLASLCVPRLADCCSVYLRDGAAPSDLAIAHVVPEKAALVRDIYERFPLPPGAPQGFPAALRSGRAEMVREVTDEDYVRMAQSPEHLAALRAVGAVSWMVIPLRVDDREPFAVLALVHAESGRHFTDEDLALAEEVARRAALVLDHARLFEAAQRERARAEEATRAKDEFLAVLSHELRTPLNAILGWSRLLRAGTHPPDRVARGLEVIERSGAAQAQLIGDLLDVSRIITGNVRLEVGSVDISNVVEMSIEAIAPAAGAKAIWIEQELERTGTIIRGDASRLQQVIWNLLTNAVKFTPKNGRVVVRLRRVASDVELVVQDDGPGIDAAALPFVFDRFRQEDATIIRAFGGLGLGLAIARHLVELHGGTIAASSEGKGKGATFTVRLPVSPVATTAFTRPVLPPARAPLSPSAANLAGMRVLVVEDEKDARELLVVLLEQCGVEVRAAPSVAEGLDEFQRFRPDVVLSDIGMPVADGYDLVRKVRALPDEAGGNAPMVALTAYAGDEDRTRARVAGFNAHLAKPIEPSELLDVLSALRFQG
ncbi:MAG TPA: ATP-binding protein [Polyangiaceae bacterium]